MASIQLDMLKVKLYFYSIRELIVTYNLKES